MKHEPGRSENDNVAQAMIPERYKKPHFLTTLELEAKKVDNLYKMFSCQRIITSLQI